MSGYDNTPNRPFRFGWLHDLDHNQLIQDNHMHLR